MKNKKDNKINYQKFLKRKKAEAIQLDTYINRINQIKIEKINSGSKLTIIEEKILYLYYTTF